MRVLGVIPARLNSTRLPRKVLRDIAGKPMLQHVYERARQCKQLGELIVATDSIEVGDFCVAVKIPYRYTSLTCRSGTDRAREAAHFFPDAEVIVNIQADEPLVTPIHIQRLLDTFSGAHQCPVATLWQYLADEDRENPDCVKVQVYRDCGTADDFSRYRSHLKQTREPDQQSCGQHIGVYAYTREILCQFHSWEPAERELAERLEQLRFLEHGVAIRVVDVPTADVPDSPLRMIGVDTEEDLRRVQEVITSVPCDTIGSATEAAFGKR